MTDTGKRLKKQIRAAYADGLPCDLRRHVTPDRRAVRRRGAPTDRVPPPEGDASGSRAWPEMPLAAVRWPGGRPVDGLRKPVSCDSPPSGVVPVNLSRDDIDELDLNWR
ncbi:hypothetical protein Adu01nite_92160 [Paractinoplanes durhamensis]|uniref:Uncharacterized protein n=1 Tax=Paractinoplanes durhamensis TaxID=113563 RepID=A0ABQ3ZDL0_9ACTN|nr:hypothetical protein Adu01nite_92160 [Actinoplanes durhamensis]